MCGICGIVLKKRPWSGGDPSVVVRKMADLLRHRGPDDEGFYADEEKGVYIAQRRLSIIDLSPAGRQPYFNEDGKVATLVNGEIYNFRELRHDLLRKGHHFVSQSDCEVVLHLFEEQGRDGLKKLRGMYAAAVYDSRSGELVLARDPLGIKPLYLLENAGFVAFASEIRAFDALDLSLDRDPAGLADFLMLGCIPAPNTHIRNVRAIKPGQQVSIIGSTVRETDCFDIGSVCRTAAQERNPDMERLKYVVRDSVRRHMVSDAPIGLFLSGGIDSGTLAGIAAEEVDADVRAITIGVPGHPLDETARARLTAKQYGLNLTEIPLNQKDFEQDVEHFFQHLDLPSRDGFNTYIVSKAAKQSGLTVALSGTGGDELFAGYDTFKWVPFFGRINRVAHAFGKPGRNGASQLLRMASKTSGGWRVAELMRRPEADRRIAYLSYRGLFVGKFLEDLLQPELKVYAQSAFERYMENTAWCLDPQIPTPIAVAGLEWQCYWAPMLLRDCDALSMAHSLEVRVPLTDMEVFKTALPFLAQPTSGDGHPKWLLRQTLEKPLPSEVAGGKKNGFVFPWQNWLKGRTLADFNRRSVLADTSRLRPEALRTWREKYTSGSAYWQNFWALYVALRTDSGNTLTN